MYVLLSIIMLASAPLGPIHAERQDCQVMRAETDMAETGTSVQGSSSNPGTLHKVSVSFFHYRDPFTFGFFLFSFVLPSLLI